MIYLDTSALVARLTHEPQTARVTAWFEAKAEPLISSERCRVEFARALAGLDADMNTAAQRYGLRVVL